MKSEVRVDKWLWAMRVFKTRTVATDSCKKGRVSMGGAPVKPSRMIKVGDTVQVRRPPVTYSFRVLALTESRLGARLVPQYMENVTPREQLDLLDVVRLAGFVDRRKGLGRPTKREGRDLARWTDAMADTPEFLSGPGQDEDPEDLFDFDEEDFADTPGK